MMKEEKFDQYVRAQFASDAVIPPSHVESAVFKEVAAGARRTKLNRLGLGALIVGVCGATLFLTQEPETAVIPVQDTPAQVVDVQKIESPVVAAAEKQVRDENTSGSEAPRVDSPEVQAPAVINSWVTETEAHSEQGRPDRMERAESKSAHPLGTAGTSDSPALQVESAETWVMPANVTVKD